MTRRSFMEPAVMPMECAHHGGSGPSANQSAAVARRFSTPRAIRCHVTPRFKSQRARVAVVEFIPTTVTRTYRRHGVWRHNQLTALYYRLTAARALHLVSDRCIPLCTSQLRFANIYINICSRRLVASLDQGWSKKSSEKKIMVNFDFYWPGLYPSA